MEKGFFVIDEVNRYGYIFLFVVVVGGYYDVVVFLLDKGVNINGGIVV